MAFSITGTLSSQSAKQYDIAHWSCCIQGNSYSPAEFHAVYNQKLIGKWVVLIEPCVFNQVDADVSLLRNIVKFFRQQLIFDKHFSCRLFKRMISLASHYKISIAIEVQLRINMPHGREWGIQSPGFIDLRPGKVLSSLPVAVPPLSGFGKGRFRSLRTIPHIFPGMHWHWKAHRITAFKPGHVFFYPSPYPVNPGRVTISFAQKIFMCIKDIFDLFRGWYVITGRMVSRSTAQIASILLKSR